ncbi:MAG: hypothetical protein ABIH34_04840 [Nanoarchaeota archaeon]
MIQEKDPLLAKVQERVDKLVNLINIKRELLNFGLEGEFAGQRIQTPQGFTDVWNDGEEFAFKRPGSDDRKALDIIVDNAEGAYIVKVDSNPYDDAYHQKVDSVKQEEIVSVIKQCIGEIDGQA